MRPKRLKLGAYSVPVTYHAGYLVSEDCENVATADEDTGDIGMATIVGSWTIHVSDKSPDEANTLLHEALHLVIRNTGAYRLMGCRDDEEALISGMSQGVIELLRRNKGLAEYLVSGE